MVGAAVTYQSYDLSRYFEGDLPHSTSITVSDDDAINCAHMLAAGFNAISRNMMGDFVLAVVDTKAGVVQYDGKAEMINRLEPSGPYQGPTSFTFEASTDADTLITFFDNENGRLIYPGKFSFAETDTDDEVLAKASAGLAKAAAGKLSRAVLEDAYAELCEVKEVLAAAEVETIPAAAGVRDLVRLNEQIPALADDLATANGRIGELERRDEFECHARSAMEQQHLEANESARAELIAHVKGAYGKWSRVDPGRTRGELKAHLRGMIEVLSKFLVAIGEADADERHAVALRVCEIPEGNYLYDDA